MERIDILESKNVRISTFWKDKLWTSSTFWNNYGTN